MVPRPFDVLGIYKGMDWTMKSVPKSELGKLRRTVPPFDRTASTDAWVVAEIMRILDLLESVLRVGHAHCPLYLNARVVESSMLYFLPISRGWLHTRLFLAGHFLS
jgi:hypothetical protein